MKSKKKEHPHWSSAYTYGDLYRRKSWKSSRRTAILALIIAIIALFMSIVHLLVVLVK